MATVNLLRGDLSWRKSTVLSYAAARRLILALAYALLVTARTAHTQDVEVATTVAFTEGSAVATDAGLTR